MSLYTKIIDRQKLKDAWSRVKRNKPAAGVDEITYEEFEKDLKENLEQLYHELEEHTYNSLPVKQVFLYKGEKKRTISLYSMRDKVVHQALASELVKLFDSRLSKTVYAYRPGKAALQAGEFLEKEMKKIEVRWILKTDIQNFFDNIALRKLYAILSAVIREQDVLELIRRCCEVPELKKDGALSLKRRGLYQGLGIAPVLSNIYLMNFDYEMEQRCRVYVRYSDDIIVLDESKEKLEEIRKYMMTKLEILDLNLNEKKTEIHSVQDGTAFLGYQLSESGRQIPVKAEKNLQDRLEEIWLGVGGTEEKLKKCAEILNGWEQYYRKDREIGSIEEYATVIFMVRTKEEILDRMKALRKNYKNIYSEICGYFVSIWKNDWEIILFEYEQFFEIEEMDKDVSLEKKEPFCSVYQKLLEHESEDLWSDLMQMYADAGAYNKASKAAESLHRMQKLGMIETPVRISETKTEKNWEIKVDNTFLQLFLQLFAGREDIYGREELGEGKRRCVEMVAEPLTEEVIQDHFNGKWTVSTYLQRTNHTVKYMVVDVDISKKCLLQEQTETVLEKYLPKAAEITKKIMKTLVKMGLKGYLEYSGFRGYHIWVFFTEWIPVRYVTMLTEILDRMLEEKDNDITIEYFPNKGRIRNEAPGQSIKLPYGLHIRSGRRSMLLTDDFQEIRPNMECLMDIAKFSLQAIKRIIGIHTQKESVSENRSVDKCIEAFGELEESVKVVLERCNLMRYLCQKARTTGYLTHFERLSVLYVFGHLGEEGKAFVHTVMEFTLNYQYHVTDKFIQRIPAKPVSCLKLRDQYKQITAEYGCSCNFKRTKNCYPSPVLHAIKSSGDVTTDVTLPTSRTMSKEKEKLVVEELNIHKKVQELAGKIIEMKKQKRGIDRAIQKTETELEKIFDQAEIDCLEVDMGVLVRRKREKGYEWVIEI